MKSRLDVADYVRGLETWCGLRNVCRVASVYVGGDKNKGLMEKTGSGAICDGPRVVRGRGVGVFRDGVG